MRNIHTTAGRALFLVSALSATAVYAVPTATARPTGPTKLHARGDGDTGAAVTGWMRPDRIKFDGERAPFVVPDDDSVTWYLIGEEDGATTIAAQQVKQITNYLGAVESATIGDVMIFKGDAVAEAIGSIMPGGQRGELYNIIACNVQQPDGKCVMVDYDGREIKETISKVIPGSTGTFQVQQPTAAPAGLTEWAEHVMVVSVATVTGSPKNKSNARRL